MFFLFQVLHLLTLKGIVQLKKRGVERGTIRTVVTLHSIDEVFLAYLKGYSCV